MTVGNVAVVVTTIQRSTESLQALGACVRSNGFQWFVIGDHKGPAQFAVDSAKFSSIEDQGRLPFKLARILPKNHYARKNLGYLLAMRNSCDCIYETDDDNAPTADWRTRSLQVNARRVTRKSGAHWANVYAAYSSKLIWPRGLPLNQIRRVFSEDFTIESAAANATAPIQQGLANGSPDVDAVWRLVFDSDITFDEFPNLLLPRGAWCPFNSQNTWWWRDAFPLLYLPSHCSFRMTDIWRSFVAQRCLWEMDYELEFHRADVKQVRNEHDYLRDFDQEVVGYLRNEEIRQLLESCKLRHGKEHLVNNILACYQALVRSNIIGVDEIALLTAWLEDCSAVGYGSGS